MFRNCKNGAISFVFNSQCFIGSKLGVTDLNKSLGDKMTFGDESDRWELSNSVFQKN